MTSSNAIQAISQGRTDLIIELLRNPDWKNLTTQGNPNVLQWLVYYNDVTGLKLVLEKGGSLASLNLDVELGNAAFYGHWKMCDFLTGQGANVNGKTQQTLETPLHNALSKAGRPYYQYTVRLLLEKGADVHAATKPGEPTGAFMRDVRTKGETPLHRAAAYADLATIELLLKHGANKEARDAHGNTPLSWASEHLRPGNVLAALAYGEHTIHPQHQLKNTSDHGNGWGTGMDWNLMGEPG